METLYDLLGALPEDGAEGLRAAFRSAVKHAHPDIVPGDPDAGLKFRRIVRANEILSDVEQRAAYDHLLDLADIEQKEGSRRAVAATIHRLATGAMVLAVTSLVFIAGYMLFGYFNNVPLTLTQTADASRAEPAKTTLVALAETPEPASRKTEVDKTDSDKADSDRQLENPGKIEDPNLSMVEGPSAPSADVVVASASTIHEDIRIPPIRDPGPPNASGYREQAISAYRNGDLYVALLKLDMAISLDPEFSDAYIDRGVVFHRLGELTRAYADIAKAKQIDDSNRRKTGAP